MKNRWMGLLFGVGFMLIMSLYGYIFLYKPNSQSASALHDTESIPSHTRSSTEYPAIQMESMDPCKSSSHLIGETMDPSWPAKRFWNVINTKDWDEPLCGGTLEIGKREVIKFVDSPRPTEGFKVYRIRDFWPKFQMFLIQTLYYRSSQYLLAGLDGKQYELFCEKPILSSSGSLLFSGCLNVGAERAGSGLAIWELDKPMPTKIYSYDGGLWGPMDYRWVSDEEIAFSQVTQDKAEKDVYHIVRNMLLSKGPDGWELKVGPEQPVQEIRQIRIRLFGCGPNEDADVASDRELFIRKFEERIKVYGIPFLYDNQTMVCDMLFENAKNLKVLNRNVKMDDELFEMAQKFFNLK